MARLWQRGARATARAALLAVAAGALAVCGAGTDAACPASAGVRASSAQAALLSDCSAEDSGSSMALIQRALEYKARDLKLSAAAAAPAPTVAVRPHGLAAAARPCVDADFEGKPVSLQARADYELLADLGFARQPRPCRHQPDVSLLSSSAKLSQLNVEQTNELVGLVTFSWVVMAIGFVGWSVYAIVRVPSKSSRPQSNKLRLADDVDAWNRGFLSWVSLSWADGLMGRYGKCWTSVVSEEEIALDTKSGGLDRPYLRFRTAWQEQVAAHGVAGASLGRAMFNVIGLKGCVTMFVVMALDQACSMVALVVVLERLLSYLVALSDKAQAHPNEEQSYLEPAILVFLAVFVLPMIFRSAAIICTLIDGYYTQICTSGLASVVFEKALNLPAGSAPQEELSAEEDPDGNMNPNVIQLFNTDILGCWDNLLRSLFCLVLAPCVIIVQFIMLVTRIHAAGFVGFLYCVPAIVLTTASIKVNIGFFKNQQGFLDNRLKKLTETITHIRTLKSLALESTAFEQLNRARQSELVFMQRCVVGGGFTMAIAASIPWGSVVLALWYLLKVQGSIAVVQILIVQRLMGSMLLMIMLFTSSMQKLIAFPNSVARIKRYMGQDDRPEGIVEAPPAAGPLQPIDESAPAECAPLALRLAGSFSFFRSGEPTLRDLDITVREGELVAVIGGVASGKTALLQAAIGELFPTTKDATIVCPDVTKGEVAFCSQVPWIFEGTLKENVVMKGAFDQQKYFQALHAAALTPDLEILPGADAVMIGSHGIRLSGGQRARVALARAAYLSSSKVVFLDDPFASVDVHTSNHLFDELVLGPSMAGRTRIVAMQPSASRLRRFDRVLLMDGGRIVEAGTPEEVIASEAFGRLQDLTSEASQGPGAKGEVRADGAAAEEAVASICRRRGQDTTGVALREAEDQDHITMKTIHWWLRVAGYKNLAFFLSMVFCNRFLDVFQTVLLASWINDKVEHDVDDRVYMLQIIIRTVVASASIVITAWAASRVGFAASSAIHSHIISAILRAPIDKFFDKQPIGRLINRLSSDMRVADDAVPWVFSTLLGFCASFVIAEGYILRVLPWQIISLSIPFFVTALFFAYVYRGTAVPLIFANKFARSRVHDLQAVCVTSNVSIRANGMVQEFVERFNDQSALVIRCNFLSASVCVAWVQSRIFLCLTVLTTIFTFFGLWTRMPVGTLTIIVVLANNQMALFENLSHLLTNALNVLNALQRLARYLDVPQEPPSKLSTDPTMRISAHVQRSALVALESRGAEKDSCGCVAIHRKGDAAPLLLANADGSALVLQDGRALSELAPGCPALGEAIGCYHIVAVNGIAKDAAAMAEELCQPRSACWVECWQSGYAGGLGVAFEKLTAGYNTEKAVLQSLTFTIAPRVKCGIVGATGCGKSTTLLCLLRILEARSGRVLVGDLDISQVGLKLLRTIVGLVPQDATIFEGSWRTNIDPFKEYPDGRIWDALRCAHLMAHVRSLPDGIDSKVTADGGNMSFGQKQLLSMARMVIRQPPVLLLDECTSALDPVTQKSVQNTVLNAFPMSTVISIAHRVETLLDFDQIVVLDRGSVAENGTVREVLSLKDGMFAKMVSHASK